MYKNSISQFGHQNGFPILPNHALCQAAAKQTCIDASLQFSSEEQQWDNSAISIPFKEPPTKLSKLPSIEEIPKLIIF